MGSVDSTGLVPAMVAEDAGAMTLSRLIEHAPAAVLAGAQEAAEALKGIISRKRKPVMMNGEQYLEFEDWQTVGRFYGITPRVDSVEFVDFAGVRGFHATAVALHDGRVVSRAEAYCLTDEEKWRSRTVYKQLYVCKDGSKVEEDPGPDAILWEDNPYKPGKRRPTRERVNSGTEPVPLFQLASMAQTRAAAKCMRNVLSWIAVLAGYKPTPAEELDARMMDAPAAPSDQVWPVERPAEARPAEAHEPARDAEPVPDGSKAACPKCAKPAFPSRFPKPGRTHYCGLCKFSFEPGAPYEE